MLGILFLVTGLGSIGFPGTLGFVGTELLLDGVRRIPLVATAIVAVAALNGLAVLHAYFRVFTGVRHVTSIDLKLRWPEQVAVLIFTALILGGGLYPQPGVESRYHAAVKLIEIRQQRLAGGNNVEPGLAGSPPIRDDAAE
jgi:NADH-quinone oxidoreductase subunit M